MVESPYQGPVYLMHDPSPLCSHLLCWPYLCLSTWPFSVTLIYIWIFIDVAVSTCTLKSWFFFFLGWEHWSRFIYSRGYAYSVTVTSVQRSRTILEMVLVCALTWGIWTSIGTQLTLHYQPSFAAALRSLSEANLSNAASRGSRSQ